MDNTLTRYLEGIHDRRDAYQLRRIMKSPINALSSQPLTSAGLVIHGAASLVAKTGAAAFYAVANGVLVTIAAATDMPALTGINAPAGGYNVACFYIDSASVVTALGGTSAATLGGVIFPTPPDGKALVGFLIITYASAFTGGTTALDTATTVYVSPLGAFDPSALV